MIGDIQFIGRAWVLPHPDRAAPAFAPMVRDEEIERIAVAAAIAHEEAQGWQVESVEQDNRGFDLDLPQAPPGRSQATAIEVRFIEVKGRAGTPARSPSPPTSTRPPSDCGRTTGSTWSCNCAGATRRSIRSRIPRGSAGNRSSRSSTTTSVPSRS
jgi:hypothetical protein